MENFEIGLATVMDAMLGLELESIVFLFFPISVLLLKSNIGAGKNEEQKLIHAAILAILELLRYFELY